MVKKVQNKDMSIAIYLAEIQYSLCDIASYIEGKTSKEFCKETLLVRAVAQALSQVGEAAHKIKTEFPDFAIKYSYIEWQQLYHYRNKISHHYHVFSPQKLWDNLQENFFILKQEFDKILILEPEIKKFVDIAVDIYYAKYST